jgi:phosphoglycerol transferase MdoB-like AlkP superfamily enzyme
MVFNLVAEGFFFEEYQSRYNTVAIDYLIYPHEVFVNVWEAYPVPAVVAVVLAAAVGITWFGWRTLRAEEAMRGTGSARRGVVAWLLLAVLLRVSVSVDETRFSRERSLNELSNNTFLALASAALTRNLDYAQFYPTLPKDEAWARVRRLMSRGPKGGEFIDPTSLIRQVPGDVSAPKKNVVLLLEESLGSEFWGSLGRSGPSLMPRMDAIATNEAVLFDNLYADGNRTIRGYEGVFCSFPPLPGDSIVARDRTDNVETIARVMSRDGYDTTFVYAGRGLFDGTGAFAKANGWSNFVELKDFKAPTFTTVWGVCNEDLYDRVLEECRDRHRRGLPFLVTSMSVSNHKPYTYPPGRIAEDPLERKRDNAVKYSDFALGRFFEMARKEPFWTNTIFAVIADHGARVYGSQTIPIRSYEIPMVLVGPAVGQAPRRVSTLGCQLDIAPTLLGMIGRPYQSLFFGRDLLGNPDTAARCLLHHNRSVGIYDQRRLVVFSLNRKVEYFEGDPKVGQMTRAAAPDAVHQDLEKDAIALFQVADELYMTRRFRMPVPADAAVR